MLIYHILKEAGLNVGLAGNVGDSLALQVAEKNFELLCSGTEQFSARWDDGV